ncbi:mechanosensitive ion channel family protein [Sphingomonas glacialis]|uniref:Small-conductance mechanosensitive channel n=1 Tax=Sphingomonas glacialis TaxID=658225 RepID=A0A502G3X9_9SPHN|nr:mechanosensitive ion channel family protein [Sphingomonas glacialis]TPG56559.1 small-conductance mechanosensitive channel [Sphingomonas glacialis]
MNTIFLPATILALTLVSVLIVRSRPLVLKLSCELLLLIVILACLVARGTSPLPSGTELARHADAAWLRALAVVWWLIGARVVAAVVAIVLGHDARSRPARLFSDLLAGAIYLATVLIILNSVLDLPVNGLLATSGVIAIVLGLALQNTLADVFSGIAVGVDRPFRVGDRVTIKDHAEGMIVEATWRSVRIQTEQDDIATIPNSVVARGQIINHSFPTERRAASIEVPTRSSARSELLLELVRQATLLSPSVLEQPAPSVSLKRVGLSTTTLGVHYYAATTSEMGKAKGQLLRQVRRLFRHAGIENGSPPPLSEVLRQTTLFDSLPSEQIEALSRCLANRALAPGDVLFDQGSAGASLYIVRSGVLNVERRHEAGAIERLGRVGPGEYLGAISMMTGEPHPVTVTAETFGSVLEIPRGSLETLLKKNEVLSAALEQAIRQGMIILDGADAARTCDPIDRSGTVLARIRDYLLSSSGRHGVPNAR